MCAGGSAHEMWQVLCVYHAVQCAETIQERIEAHYTLPKSKKKMKTSFQIMDKTRNKTKLMQNYATHFFISRQKNGETRFFTRLALEKRTEKSAMV
jgi:Na+/melibiose symporter-like transporter